MKRPTGVTVMAVLLFLGGVFSVIGAIGSFGLGLAGIGIIALILGIAYLVVAYGLWTLKPWAWLAALALIAIGALYTIIQLIAGWTTLWSAIISLAIDAVIVYYLFRPEIRAAFGRS